MQTFAFEIHPDQHAHKMPFGEESLSSMGYQYFRVFEDGQVWAVAPYSISNGRLFVDLESTGYRDFYCFCDYPTALKALQEFDPANMKEPEGWHRHFSTSRRRPDGDASKEYINP
jgi:hypothetical protein